MRACAKKFSWLLWACLISLASYTLDEELNQCSNNIPGFVAQLEGLTAVPVSSDSRKTRDPVILCIICRVFKSLKSSSRRQDPQENDSMWTDLRGLPYCSLVPRPEKRAWYTPFAHALTYPYIYRQIICKLSTNTWRTWPLTAGYPGHDSISQS